MDIISNIEMDTKFDLQSCILIKYRKHRQISTEKKYNMDFKEEIGSIDKIHD